VLCAAPDLLSPPRLDISLRWPLPF
jgi:hypothetical protein